MKQKTFLFNSLLSLTCASLFQGSYSIGDKNFLETLKIAQVEGFKENLLTFVCKDNSLRSSSTDSTDDKTKSIDIQILGKIIDESFELEDFDLPIQQRICKEFFSLFDGKPFQKSSLEIFTKPSLQFMNSLFISNFQFNVQIDGSHFISFNSLNYLYFNAILNYYDLYPDQLLIDLDKFAFGVLYLRQGPTYNNISSKFELLLYIIIDQEFQVIRFKNKGKPSSRFNLCDIHSIYKILDYIISLNNENILNVYCLNVILSIDRVKLPSILTQLYHKYGDKLPFLLRITHFAFNSPSKSESQKLIQELEPLVDKNLGPAILTQICNVLSALYPFRSPQRIKYTKLLLLNNYDYDRVLLLSELLFFNQEYKNSAALFKNILDNVTNYNEYLFTKETVLLNYILCLQELTKEENSELLDKRKQQLSQAILELQELKLQSRPKFKKINKDENHKKRIAKLKAALQEYYQEQENLEQQKKEQILLEQQRKEQLQKNKQAWALEHQGEILLPQPDVQPKRKKKKNISMASIEQALPSTSFTTHTNQTKEISYIVIENLIHGNPLKTFYKFFNMGQDQKTDRQIDISMHEFSTLMESLGQKMEPSKGSHKKITFNFDHLFKESEKQMLIIAKHTYLLPYQIKQVREKFLDYGLCPKELIDKFENQCFTIKQ